MFGAFGIFLRVALAGDKERRFVDITERLYVGGLIVDEIKTKSDQQGRGDNNDT